MDWISFLDSEFSYAYALNILVMAFRSSWLRFFINLRLDENELKRSLTLKTTIKIALLKCYRFLTISYIPSIKIHTRKIALKYKGK